MADDVFRCTTMVGQRKPLSDWADRFAAEMPPFTQTEIGAVAAIARQIDERMDGLPWPHAHARTGGGGHAKAPPPSAATAHHTRQNANGASTVTGQATSAPTATSR